MPMNDRPFSDVVQDIIHNVQEIVRSEVRLAKTEIREEAGKAKSAGLLIGIGAFTAFFAVAFLLVTAVYALSLVLPSWAAALIVAITLAVAAGITLNTGLKRFKAVHATPERTIETVKENAEWIKHPAK